MRKLLAAAALCALGGCQSWGPTWSELVGYRDGDITSLTDGPVVVNLIDGESPNNPPRQPIKVTPGKHTLVLQGVPPGAVVGLISLEKTEVDFKPCTRYYINAKFTSSTSTEWRPFIQNEEKIPGCQLPQATK